MRTDVHPDQARRIDHALGLLAAMPDPRPLPDPAPLYWRAQVIARLGETRQAAERAVRPLAWLQRASLAAAALALAAGVALGWDLVAAELERLASGALPAGGPDPTAIAALAAGLAVAVVAGGGLTLLHALSEEA